jgi:hypothetical protein
MKRVYDVISYYDIIHDIIYVISYCDITYLCYDVMYDIISVEFARDPVIIMDALQSAHMYPLSSLIEIGLPDGLAISTFSDGPRSTLCRPGGRCTTSISSIGSPSSVKGPL